MNLEDIVNIRKVDFDKDYAELYYTDLYSPLTSRTVSLLKRVDSNPEKFLIKTFIDKLRKLSIKNINSKEYPNRYQTGDYDVLPDVSFITHRKKMLSKIVSCGSLIDLQSRVGPGNIVLSHPNNKYVDDINVSSLASFKTNLLNEDEVIVYRKNIELTTSAPELSLVISKIVDIDEHNKEFKYSFVETGFYVEKNYVLFKVNDIIKDRKEKLKKINNL